jgi:flagellar biosynthesis/type III secretory pathway chaperone
MQPDATALSGALSAEITALRGFVALLREEQQALIHGTLDRLTSFTEPKAKCMLELTRLAELRLQLLRAGNLPADRSGMERFVREYANSAPQVQAAWQEVLSLTADAHHLNDLNGTLIATRLRGTQQALSALFSAARIPGAYAADGSTVPFHTAHKLAVA